MPADCAPVGSSAPVELGRFLRTRRARLRPEQVGLFAPGPRRVPGLRREEAAMIAGLSLSYYTRIEQGQVSPPSHSVLSAIGREFRLEPDEVRYLHHLADARREAPSAGGSGDGGGDQSTDRSAARLVDAISTPAIVVDHALDIVAWNDTARLELGDGRFLADGTDGPDHEERPNLARLVLLDPIVRGRLDDPDRVAAWVVGHLRFQLARRPADPDLARLLGDLAGDERFRALWARHDVHDLGPAIVGLLLGPGRPVRMRVDALRRPQFPDETLLTFSPDPEPGIAVAVASATTDRAA